MNSLYKLLQKNPLYFVHIPLIAYWVLLFILTSIPVQAMPSFGITDKFEHFGAFFILSFLLYLSLHFKKWKYLNGVSIFIFTMIIGSLYGAFDEFHQLFIPGRFAEFFDWFADFLGSAAGAYAANLIIKRNLCFE